MMRKSTLAMAIALAWGAQVALGTEPPVTVAGSQSPIQSMYHESALLVHLDQVAQQFGWQAKVIKPGELVALCRAGQDALCVPIRIDQVQAVGTPDGLFVSADVLATVLGFHLAVDGGRVQLVPMDPKASLASGEAPHPTGRGVRGFQVGQTVPDIPLIDLAGREVRFSRFLGKKYIIYCWASW